MLSIEHISKSFHHKKVLRDVGFSLPEGEHVALLGPNGTGKTTLLKILAGIVRPLTGSAVLDGNKLFTEDSSHRDKLIFWGHAPMFYPALTGMENLALFFKLRKESVARNLIMDQLEKFHLDQHLNESVRTYSAGMLQRLTMIRLSLSNWRLALIDEPTTGLDIEGLSFLHELTTDWREQGRAVLFSTHDADWVVDNAQRILLLKNGEVAHDTTDLDSVDIRLVMQGKF